MVEIGQIYDLEVVKVVDFGVYLDADELGEVLLPQRHVPEDIFVGDSLQVFLYHDSEDRFVATTQTPKALVGEFAYLNVVDESGIGAFLDIGLDKDILLPLAEQHRPVEVGSSYLVYLYLDRVDGRIVASSKIDKFLFDEKQHRFQAQQAADLIIANTTDLGYKVIINHSHWGVLHKSDLRQGDKMIRLSFGQSIKGYIKHVRPDGRIDVSLESSKAALDKNAAIVLKHLRENGGFSDIHDKSDPADIKRVFHLSKNAFKRAVGNLYKQKIIAIEGNGIRLL